MTTVFAAFVAFAAGFAVGQYRGKNPERFASKLSGLFDKLRGKDK